jgi:hypothetical protein
MARNKKAASTVDAAGMNQTYVKPCRIQGHTRRREL